MKQEEVIEMARQAGYQHPYAVGQCEDFAYFDIEAFAKLIAAKEREACAKVCDDIRHPWGYSAETSDWERGTEHCADAIRARSGDTK